MRHLCVISDYLVFKNRLTQSDEFSNKSDRGGLNVGFIEVLCYLYG